MRYPKSAEQSWQVFQYALNDLPAKYLEKLRAGVLRRIGAPLKTKGGHTSNTDLVRFLNVYCALWEVIKTILWYDFLQASSLCF